MAKYDSITKRARNQAVIEMHKVHPELALKEIGDFYNISKQRVYAILKRQAREQKIG